MRIPHPRRKDKKKKPQRNIQKVSRKPLIGRILVVALAVVLCTIPAIFINNALGYLPIFTLVFIIAISFAYLQILVHSLEFAEDSTFNTCQRGTDVDFSVDFKNKCPLVFLRIDGYFFISDLFGETDTSIPASLVLMPFEERDFEFSARFDHIGEYSAGVEKVVIYDLLGLFSRTIKNDKQHTVSVLPKIFDISSLDLSNVSVQENSRQFQPIVTDDMDYAGVREYVYGDPLKTIHWKLSARLLDGQYFTRLFETQGNPGVTVITDGTAPGYDSESLMQIFDGVVESAVSVCLHAYEQGIDAELVYADTRDELHLTHVLNVGDSMALIKDMPRIKVEEGLTALECLRTQGTSIHGQSNIAYCTSHVNEDIISALIEIKVRKRNPLLFVVVPDTLEGDERHSFLAPLKRLEAAGIIYYVLSSAEDLLEEVL